MLQKLCDALLRRVYDSITAVVCMNDVDKIIGLQLFDTNFGAQGTFALPGTKRICVICNHPEGRKSLTGEEVKNACLIDAHSAGAQMQIYIYGEDIGLLPVDKSGVLGYNDENVI